MATIFRVKRSETAGNPAVLAAGEFAYSALTDNGSNGGDRLYIGMGTETGGNAANHIVVGGKFFTDMLDHNKGTLTANSAVIVDASGKIDVFNVDNLTLDGNTLSSTDLNGNIVLDPNGTGYISASSALIKNLANPVDDQDAVTKSYLQNYLLGGGDGIESIQDIVGGMVDGSSQSGIVVTYNDTAGTLEFNVSDPNLTISGDGTATATMTDLGNTDLAFTLNTVNSNVGTFGSTTAIPVVTVNGKGLVTAMSTVDVATVLDIYADNGAGDSIDLLTEALTINGGEGMDVTVSGNVFTVTGEDASDINKGVASFDATDFTVTAGAVVVNTITLGTSALNPGETTTTLAGLQSLAVDNLFFDGNTISTTNVDGDLVIAPNGAGAVDFNGAVATNLGFPTQATDAVTKAYADSLATGLDAKESVRAATTGPITLSGVQVIDGVNLVVGNRVLVKNQADLSTNGIYVVADLAWSRATDFDEPYEVTANAYTFVEEGTVNGDNGFVLTTNDPITLGSDDLIWVQFSGAGQVIAGEGLSKIGNQLDVNVNDTTGGIEISGDHLQLMSSVAGAGLTYTAGVVDVVGTANRITVNADSIDIAATYVGQTSITTLGTIATGTWNADVVEVTYGGTGRATLTANAVVYGNGTSPVGLVTPATVEGSVLKQDATGAPYMSNIIDGGTY